MNDDKESGEILFFLYVEVIDKHTKRKLDNIRLCYMVRHEKWKQHPNHNPRNPFYIVDSNMDERVFVDVCHIGRPVIFGTYYPWGEDYKVIIPI